MTNPYGFNPELIHPSAFTAAGAVVVGRVHLAESSSVWFNSVLRGDVEGIFVGPRTNVQDGCLLHTSHGFPVHLAEGVTVGHGAVVHGARVGAHALVGIRAVLLDGVRVGEESLVAAGSLLPPGKRYPPGSLILGSPARVVRPLTPEEMEHNREIARHYVERARRYKTAT
jgi:carbonic anhydrase/acetyltransferase-like protein (isoleucine patch superfamily)